MPRYTHQNKEMDGLKQRNRVSFNLKNQAVNTRQNAKEIFQVKVNGWQDERGQVSIHNRRLRIKLPARHGSKNGVVARLMVPERQDYVLEFKVLFQKGFSFARGGKVGFGFVVGEGVTGGRREDALANKGGSFRVIWRKRDGTKDTVLAPYVYYRDMKAKYGHDFKKFDYKIESGQEYRVRISMKMNTAGHLKNGYGKLEIRGPKDKRYQKVWENKRIRWSGHQSASKRRITAFYLSTFRGGAGRAYDGRKGTQYVYFDDLAWSPFKR